jgi:hypothetical protein
MLVHAAKCIIKWNKDCVVLGLYHTVAISSQRRGLSFWFPLEFVPNHLLLVQKLFLKGAWLASLLKLFFRKLLALGLLKLFRLIHLAVQAAGSKLGFQ